MTQKITLLSLSVLATGVILAERFIGPSGATATAGGNAYGVSTTSAPVGALVETDVLGTTIVTAGAAIAAGALVEVGTAGKAITKAAGTTVARMAPGASAAADGDRVEVILLPN